MDALDELLIQTQRDVEDTARKLGNLEIKLKALQEAARLRPTAMDSRTATKIVDTANSLSDATTTRRLGKAPGAISDKWRDIIIGLDDGLSHRPPDFFAAAGNAGIKTTSASIRDRIRAYAQMGFLTGDTSSGFQVSRAFRNRFISNYPANSKAQKDILAEIMG